MFACQNALQETANKSVEPGEMQVLSAKNAEQFASPCVDHADHLEEGKDQANRKTDSMLAGLGSTSVDVKDDSDRCASNMAYYPGCILPTSCMVPRSNAFDEFRPLVHKQVIFFVRHGQSRWNEAQAARNWLRMYQESDHGLSETGRQQAIHLCSQIIAKKHLLNSGAVTEAEALWLTYFFVPQFICSSPFTRAIETAIIGLQGLLLTHGRLVVMKEAREQKNFGGADSSGVAIGDQIITRVKEELDCLYENAGQSEELNKLLNHLASDIEVDVSGMQEAWWSSVLERDAEIAERVQKFLENIRLQGAGSSSIVVGHSHMFRRIFQNYIAEALQQKKPDIVASLRKHVIPCCGVVGCELEWSLDGHVSITDIMPVLGTELQPVEDVTQEGRDAQLG